MTQANPPQATRVQRSYYKLRPEASADANIYPVPTSCISIAASLMGMGLGLQLAKLNESETLLHSTRQRSGPKRKTWTRLIQPGSYIGRR
jgi:hypothetical protein